MAEAKGIRLGKVIVTTVRQPEGAPVLDGGITRDADGVDYGSLVLLLRPWRRSAHGDRASGRALVVGWRGRPTPNPQRWIRARRRMWCGEVRRDDGLCGRHWHRVQGGEDG